MVKQKYTYKFEVWTGREYRGNNEFKTIASVVVFANNYHQHCLVYDRVRYHLNRTGEYYYVCLCGRWQYRITKFPILK
jgi:hypothetical protein